MTRARWIVLGILLAALAGTQHFGLERQPETKAENALRNLPEVSAGDMLPTYVASLFFGAFRAVAIDILWIQLKRAEEERRWYERRDILKLISYVQPRNPEVWSHLGWHSAYNVANGFTDPEKSWSWIRFGLTWLRQGTRMLPDNPHLKFELAFTLMHKPSWRDAELDLPLLRRIESDEDLQKLLRPDDLPPGGPPRSAFELSRLWLERAKADIAKGGEKRHRTQMGLFIYPSTLDGYIRKTLFLECARAWQEGDIDRAVARARDVEAHTSKMLKTPYDEGPLSGLFKDFAEFYRDLPAAIVAHGRAKASGTREDGLAALKALQDLMTAKDQILDEGFIWSRVDPRAPLNALKRRFAGEDEGECNDAWVLGWTLKPGASVAANLAPAGLDVDWYWLNLEGPRGQAAPAKPLKLRLTFNRPAASRAELKVTVLDPMKREVKTAEIRGKGEVEVDAPSYGAWSMKVEPLDPKVPEDSRYFAQYEVIE